MTVSGEARISDEQPLPVPFDDATRPTSLSEPEEPSESEQEALHRTQLEIRSWF